MQKICIIKLGALGDVVRTLPILIGIKEKFPESEIVWITRKESLEIVKSSPYVNEVLVIPFEISESFDVLYNFDVDDEATNLAEKINASEKFGFRSENEFVSAFNLGAEYYLNTMFDDELKKKNEKTYQEMMFLAADLPYKKQHHELLLDENHKIYANNFLGEKQANKIIGVHIGAGSRWLSKAWHREKLMEFVRKAKLKGFEIIVFGGPNEISEINEIKKEFSIKTNNPHNSPMEFASLVNLCDFMVCSDSFSLHISLGLKKPTIGLFFCTPPNEVEDYGILIKIVSPMIYDFFPEKMDEYDENLVKSISAEEVLNTIIELQNANK